MHEKKTSTSFRLVQGHDWLLLVLIGLCYGVGLLFLPYLPDQVAPHFSLNGEPTRYEPALFTLTIMPVIAVVIVLFINGVQWATSKLELDTEQKSAEQKVMEQAKAAHVFMVIKYISILFLMGPYFYIIYWNLSDTPQISSHLLMSVLFSVAYIVFGIIVYRSQTVSVSISTEPLAPQVARIINRRVGITLILAGFVAMSTVVWPESWRLPALLIVILLAPIVGMIWGFVAGFRTKEEV